jgi:hypothetical protein
LKVGQTVKIPTNDGSTIAVAKESKPVVETVEKEVG